MHSPGISLSTLVLGLLIVVAFVLVVMLAQGIGESLGGGMREYLVR
jgi:hypothetical protein